MSESLTPIRRFRMHGIHVSKRSKKLDVFIPSVNVCRRSALVGFGIAASEDAQHAAVVFRFLRSQ